MEDADNSQSTHTTESGTNSFDSCYTSLEITMTFSTLPCSGKCILLVPAPPPHHPREKAFPWNNMQLIFDVVP